MNKLFDTATVCRIIGVTRTTISRAARRIGVGQKIGPCWIFTDTDIDRLRPECRQTRGNPGGWSQANAKKRKDSAR